MRKLFMAVAIATAGYAIYDFAISAQSLVAGTVQLRSALADGIQ